MNQELYLRLVYFVNNSFRINKIKYLISSNDKLSQQFTRLIEAILTLEKHQGFRINEQETAVSFAKALRTICEHKIKIEAIDEFDDNEIEDVYESLITKFTKDYQITKARLIKEVDINIEQISELKPLTDSQKLEINQQLNPTSESDVLANKEDATDAQGKSEQITQLQPTPIPTAQSFMGNNNQPFMGNNAQFPGLENMPVMPMQRPDFYPLTSKPKQMPLVKKGLAVFGILISVVALVLWILTAFIKLDGSEILTNFIADNFIKGSDKVPNGFAESGIYTKFLGFSFIDIFSFMLFMFPIYLLIQQGMAKPKNLIQKYKFGTFLNVMIAILFVSNIFFYINFISENKITDFWTIMSDKLLKEGTDKNQLATIIETIYSKNHSLLSVIIVFSIIYIVLVSLISLFIIIAIIMNPKLDREKIARAQFEYTKAISEAMQGRKYEMDPTLFETDEEELNIKPKNEWRKSRKPKSKKSNEKEDKTDTNV